MGRFATALMITCALALAPLAADASRQQQGQQRRPAKKAGARIDMVIALDTSSSMGGLINAARQKLWDIVNEASRARPRPILRVGLVTFGSPGNAQDGHVVVQSPLTTDLDGIYEKLFALRTNGGTEYVGRAVHTSVRKMKWHRGRNTLRQIFVAGNESADQDRQVRAATAVKQARRKGIFVNAIYCGSQADGIAPSWRAVASGGKGVFAAIDHNHGTTVVATPYDRKLKELSNKLNSTYVGYGRKGKRAKVNQKRQDKNAASTHAGVAATRAAAKASAVYRADDWDLVDARKAGKKVEREAMPAELQSLSEDELGAHLDKLEQRRASIKKKIRKLSGKRKAFVKAEKKRKGKTDDLAFDAAVKRAVRSQAEAMNITIE